MLYRNRSIERAWCDRIVAPLWRFKTLNFSFMKIPKWRRNQSECFISTVFQMMCRWACSRHIDLKTDMFRVRTALHCCLYRLTLWCEVALHFVRARRNWKCTNDWRRNQRSSELLYGGGWAETMGGLPTRAISMSRISFRGSVRTNENNKEEISIGSYLVRVSQVRSSYFQIIDRLTQLTQFWVMFPILGNIGA